MPPWLAPNAITISGFCLFGAAIANLCAVSFLGATHLFGTSCLAMVIAM
jgi:hypothetical protein